MEGIRKVSIEQAKKKSAQAKELLKKYKKTEAKKRIIICLSNILTFVSAFVSGQLLIREETQSAVLLIIVSILFMMESENYIKEIRRNQKEIENALNEALNEAITMK